MKPEARAADLKSMSDSVRRKYKKDTKIRRKFDFDGEEELIKDTIVVLKLASYTNTQIAKIVGCSRGQVKEYLADEKVQKKFKALSATLPQAALELGQMLLIEAVTSIADVMRTADDGALVLKAAGDLLDRFGIPKASRQEKKTDDGTLDNIGRGGHEDVFAQVRSLSPEMQEQAAQLFDAFETGMRTLIDNAKEEAKDEIGSEDS